MTAEHTAQKPSATYSSKKNWFLALGAVVAAVFGLFINGNVSKEVQRLEDERRATACPSLLSIARSPRDTLIVMKNEPLCVTFVLDNLQ